MYAVWSWFWRCVIAAAAAAAAAVGELLVSTLPTIGKPNSSASPSSAGVSSTGGTDTSRDLASGGWSGNRQDPPEKHAPE